VMIVQGSNSGEVAELVDRDKVRNLNTYQQSLRISIHLM
jgi:hypothetical protein